MTENRFKKKIIRTILILAFVIVSSWLNKGYSSESVTRSAFSGLPVSLQEAVRGVDDKAIVAIWVFFEDGPTTDILPNNPIYGPEPVSSRARWRMKARGNRSTDLRVLKALPKERIREVRALVFRIRHISKYFNAVSVDVKVEDIESLLNLDFVIDVRSVRKYERAGRFLDLKTTGNPSNEMLSDPWFTKYGESLEQLAMTGSSDLLEAGYNGSGTVTGRDPVLICVMDTGFDLDHEAFDFIDVLIEYDFVDYDSVTAQEENDFPDQARHGTTVLGTIAGYHQGDLIGPAWGARYILAKTEILGQEIEIEEDKWVAGIEWADSIGADIVTTSLGYSDWYTSESMDGETALCTIAADIAVSRGIVVVNAMGNYGWDGDTSLIAPADGRNVIAVGALHRYGEIAGFSSRGPTADGRIKPDLVARGVDVHSVAYENVSGYGQYDGTSFAAPLIAGLCAQLLEIHPEWDPGILLEELKASASKSNDPDNYYGYGIPSGLIVSGLSSETESAGILFQSGYPNPFSRNIRFDIFLPEWETVDLKIYNCAGELVATLLDYYPLKWGKSVVWDGRNRSGARVASGVYFARFVSDSTSKTIKVVYLKS
ncbi:MAG: S8 family peptidase [Candidatus Krumholzibacteria bacterium]|nr:S8 family peptidase [Candidatus Krumholzibacteria bacterium]